MNLLRNATKAITVVHAVLTLVSVAVDGPTRGVIGLIFVAAFAAGMVIFIAAFLRAANRSRFEQVSVVGAFFLGDDAVERSDQRLMIGAVFVQTAVALAASVSRPFSAVAFSILVPLLSLALAAQFGARYGSFDPQPD